MQNFFRRNQRVFVTFLFIIVFMFTLIEETPSVMLGKIIQHYSKGHLQLYNPNGTFWNGSGLLAVADPKTEELSPLLLIDWKVKVGLKKFVSVNFSVDKSTIADFYVDKKGANLDNLNISLSVTQVSQLVDIINSLGLSGNLEIMAKHINVGKKLTGNLDI
jgi:hypothetical protein